jgi:hypothetical protein
MARTRTFSFAAPARPGCGSLRNRCGESDPPAVKSWLRHTQSPLVAVEDQLHQLSRRITPRLSVIEAGRSFVQAVSSITQVTTSLRNVLRGRDLPDRAQ